MSKTERELLAALRENAELRAIIAQRYDIPTAIVLLEVGNERVRQNETWRRVAGEWGDSTTIKLAVLTEEVGEVARAICDDEGEVRLRAELIQVAAVAVAWAETLGSAEPKQKPHRCDACGEVSQLAGTPTERWPHTKGCGGMFVWQP